MVESIPARMVTNRWIGKKVTVVSDGLIHSGGLADFQTNYHKDTGSVESVTIYLAGDVHTLGPDATVTAGDVDDLLI